MATRPISAGSRGPKVDWRTALRRSVRRSAEIAGALVLLAGMVFLALAMATYHQTDPSVSTASGGPVLNWMGAPGAWVAERALFLFGPVAVLLLPLLYVFARKLWRLVEEDDADLPHADHAWWRPIGVLLFAMALLGTVMALAFTRPGGSLPCVPPRGSRSAVHPGPRPGVTPLRAQARSCAQAHSPTSQRRRGVPHRCHVASRSHQTAVAGRLRIRRRPLKGAP